MIDSNDVQQRTNAFLTVPPVRVSTGVFLQRVPWKRFSVFDAEQLRQAIELAGRFMTIANSLDAHADLHPVLDEADKEASTHDPELVRYALMLFLTHHPRGNALGIPPIEQRAPDAVLPSSSPGAFRITVAMKGQPSEVLLNWFREDPKINEHHEHWHIVYPHQGIPDPTDPTMVHTKNRQGELFVYMHQQMLARYDTERLAVGLPPVVPLSDYRAKVEEGYDPSAHLETQVPGNPRLSPFSSRPPNEQLGNISQPGANGYVQVSGLEQWRDTLLQAAERGSFQDSTHLDPHAFGSTIESSIDSNNRAVYGDLHNMGHVFLAYINDPQHAGSPTDVPGVMISTRTALRDPIFYRWHKHIDDLYFRWQDRCPPNNFSDAPPVLIRKSLGGSTGANQSPDIILCFKDALPAGSDDSDAFWQKFGETTFGGSNWNSGFSSGPLTTGELHTMMRERTFTFVEDDRATITIQYLYPREFFYFLRVENQLDHAQDVTVRLFLVAQSFAEDRRKWIEMDKFRHTLQPKERAVIFRRAESSSVIRKPAVKTLGPVEIPVVDPGTGRSDPLAPENYCDCGWPYNLLLPRGTQAGMGFRFLVMLTDWAIDQVQDDTTCGSMSYCGAKEKYPDSRDMGYPFDRPFPANSSIAQTIAAHANMATRDITIKWVNAPPGS